MGLFSFKVFIMAKLIALSGPSCVGKTPLFNALQRMDPSLADALEKVVMYTDRAPRPGERDGVDYHFRSRKTIQSLDSETDVIVATVRNDLQAIRMSDIQQIHARGQTAFLDVNPYIWNEMSAQGGLEGIETTSIFLSPLSSDEINELKNAKPAIDLEAFVADIMRRKLLRRTQKQKGILSLRDLETIETRCTAAFRELQKAHRFDWVIPNHDGEDSDHWDAFYRPIGDARKALLAFEAILNGENTPYAEQWAESLI